MVGMYISFWSYNLRLEAAKTGLKLYQGSKLAGAGGGAPRKIEVRPKKC